MNNDLTKKNFIWNIIGTSFSAFNSLFLMIIVTRINGVEKAGVFGFAFSFACLFYIIGIYSGRVFQVTDLDETNDSYSYINAHIISCLLMFILAIIFCLIRGYSPFKWIIILLLIVFKMLEAFSETLYAIIQNQNKLYKVGISLFLKAIIGLFAFFTIEYFFKNLIAAIIGLVFVNLLFIIIYDLENTNLSLKDYNFKLDIILKIFKIGFFTFIFTFLNLYLINLSKYMIDFVSEDDIQTIFSILVMPATIVSMFAQFIFHPIILKVKELIIQNDYRCLLKLTHKVSLIIVAFGTIAVMISYFVGIPILNLIYGINLSEYKILLIIVLIGAIFYSIMTVYSNILTACRKTFIQMVVYLSMSILCTIISIALIRQFSISGAVYSYFITMLLIFISYLFVYYYNIYKYMKGV